MRLLYSWIVKAQQDAQAMRYPFWLIVFRAAYNTKSFFLTDAKTAHTLVPDLYVPRKKQTDHRTTFVAHYNADLLPLIPARAALQLTFTLHNWVGYIAPIELLPPPTR